MHFRHPLRFHPLFRSYIWGGSRLENDLKKPVPESKVWAESWELVDHGLDQSIVAEGPHSGKALRELIELDSQGILGTGVETATFPLLLKFLDCNRVLSVQVHPNDDYAKKMPQPDLGKTEAWYVIDREPGAKVYAGLKEGVTQETLRKAIQSGSCEELLHIIEPEPGDCIFIPAGTVHALGAGLLVAEIQQASDTTFRLFDWNRVDDQGRPRPLHVEQALEVTNYEAGPVNVVLPIEQARGVELLVSCPYFELNRYTAGPHRLVSGGFKIVTVVRGDVVLQDTQGKTLLAFGQTALLPASHEETQLSLGPESVALVASLPNSNRGVR